MHGASPINEHEEIVMLLNKLIGVQRQAVLFTQSNSNEIEKINN